VKKKTILVVEDSDLDFELLQMALKESSFEGEIVRCTGGEEALIYLQDVQNDKSLNTMPLLVFLDLNMPGTNGYEVLNFARSHNDLKELPIIIFTGSCDIEDVKKAYRAGANSYIIKPLNFTILKKVIAEVKKYWLEVAEIPTNDFKLSLFA
jgi:CheY-like chemotaxis protein